jgi:hypothetical protein
MWNSLITVPFQTPAVPFETSISLANMKPQRRDSYQPIDNGDHSKRCTLIGEGSMPRTVARCMARMVAAALSLISMPRT